MTDLDVVIVSYNTRQLLDHCLRSLPAACHGIKVLTYVVDNASRDGSAEMVEREHPAVRLIRNSDNKGFAHANNAALGQCSGRYVVLLNPDTIVRPGALSRLVQFMDETPSAGYCGPKLLNEDGSLQPSARRFPTVLSAAYAILDLQRRRPLSRHTLEMHAVLDLTGPAPVDWMTGACLLVRRAAIDQVGLLDDGYFMYFEETDWCRRMARAGWQGWYVPDAEVVHFGGRSVVHESELRPFSGDHPVHWVRSSRRYMRRNLGIAGMCLSAAIEVGLYGMIWSRHVWRREQRSRDKARTAAAALQYLMARG